MNLKLITLEHDKKEKRVWIVFADFGKEKDRKIKGKDISFEEAILEDHEFYDLVKNVLVKWGEGGTNKTGNY